MNYCRCHAINNFLGYDAISFQEFNKYCDNFDTISGFPLISKKEYYFYNNMNNDNIFSYILKKLGYNFKFNIIMNYNMKKINYDNNTKGFIIFNNHHTWCIRKVNNMFYIIDSLSFMIKKLNTEQLNKYLLNCKGIIIIN